MKSSTFSTPLRIFVAYRGGKIMMNRKHPMLVALQRLADVEGVSLESLLIHILETGVEERCRRIGLAGTRSTFRRDLGTLPQSGKGGLA